MTADTQSLIEQLETNISEAIFGKEEVVRMCLVALLAGEHVLLEDVPGVGKTLMAKALARSVSGSFTRIQFTPDLLPSDIMGSSVYDTNQGTFTFNRGPLFANIVLADEINRTPPRTQSALLEAMSDRQVSADGETHELPNPFMVVATQNPFEFEGTYPLPESQLDRFLFRISLGYPDRDEEKRVLVSHRENNPVDILDSVITAEQVMAKRGKDKVILAGMSANLCVEAHMRELLEQGFEVAVVSDATAAAQHPELGDGYASAMTNFGFMANAVLTTDEVLGQLS